jgi:hypothetical protein
MGATVGFRGFVFALGLLLVPSVGAFGKGTGVGWEESEALCHLQLAAPKPLTGQVLDFAQRVYGPGQNLRMLPMLFLGLWGYPDFPDISETEPIHVFFFPSEDALLSSARWVACVRMGEKCPIRSALALQGFQLRDDCGWVFAAPQGDLLEKVSGSWLGWAEAFSHGLRLEISQKLIHRLATNFEKLTLGNLAEVGDLRGNMQALSLLNFLLRIVSQLEGLAVTVDIADALTGRVELRLGEESDLLRIFIAPPGDCSDLSALLPSDGLICAVSRYNPQALSRLLQDLLDGFFCPGTEGVAEGEIYSHIEDFFRCHRGISAEQLSVAPSGELVLRRYLGLRASHGQLAEWVEFTFSKLLPALLPSLASSPDGPGVELVTEVERQAFCCGDFPVLRARMEVRSGEAGEPSITREFYLCALGELVAISSDGDALRRMVEDVARGRAEGETLADVLPMEAGMVRRTRIDFSHLLQAMADAHPDRDPPIIPPLPPATFDFSLDENCARIDFTLGAETLGALLQLLCDQ